MQFYPIGPSFATGALVLSLALAVGSCSLVLTMALAVALGIISGCACQWIGLKEHLQKTMFFFKPAK